MPGRRGNAAEETVWLALLQVGAPSYLVMGKDSEVLGPVEGREARAARSPGRSSFLGTYRRWARSSESTSPSRGSGRRWAAPSEVHLGVGDGVLDRTAPVPRGAATWGPIPFGSCR